jgi:Lsr2
MMTTVTQVKLTCDVCGDTNEVKTRTFGLDGKAYEIDLCRKDGNALGRVAARYVAKARKVTAKRRRRQHGGRPRQEAEASRSGQQAATVSGATARASGSRKAAKASRSQGQNADGSSTAAAGDAGVQRQKGIYVYGILPADIEVAVGIPGVGEHPGLLRDVRFDGLAALISEVDSSGTSRQQGCGRRSKARTLTPSGTSGSSWASSSTRRSRPGGKRTRGS